MTFIANDFKVKLTIYSSSKKIRFLDCKMLFAYCQMHFLQLLSCKCLWWFPTKKLY